MSKSFLERQLDKEADHDIEVWIRTRKIGTTGDIAIEVTVENEDDPKTAAMLLETAANFLRDK